MFSSKGCIWYLDTESEAAFHTDVRRKYIKNPVNGLKYSYRNIYTYNKTKLQFDCVSILSVEWFPKKALVWGSHGYFSKYKRTIHTLHSI